MLVLTRTPQEFVVVGSADALERMLTVTVLAIRGGAVRLGFEACSDFPIHRGEVWERVQAGGPARPCDRRTRQPL